MKHALFNASSAHIWTKCPSSALLSKLAPVDEAGTAAKKGTALHKISDQWFHSHMRNEEYTPPIIDGISDVRFFVEYLIKEEQAGQRPLTEEYVGDFRYLYGGTADALMLNEVADLKTGKTIVHAEGNMQLEALAYFADLRDAKLTIIQGGRAESANQKESGAIFTDAITSAACGEAVFKKGEHCRWCKGKSLCPEYGNAIKASKQVSNDF